MDNDYGDEDMEEKPMADKGEAEHEEEESQQSALLPKTVLGGKEFKPGDEVVLKIDHIYEDEVEVSYATAKEGKPPKPKSSMEHADDAMDRMATMKEY